VFDPPLAAFLQQHYYTIIPIMMEQQQQIPSMIKIKPIIPPSFLTNSLAKS
jgi:hypothetical protein